MKKKEIKTEKKLSLEKFKVAELKNSKAIFGGLAEVNNDGNNTITLPTSR